MKKLIISVLFCLVSISLSAQNTFFKWYPSDNYEYMINAFEVSNGDFILSGSRSESNDPTANAYLLKIDSNGNYLIENELGVIDTNSCFTVAFVLPNETSVLNYANSKKIVNTNGSVQQSISFEKINTNDLSIIEKKEYLTPVNKIIAPQRVLINETNIYILSHYSEYNPNYQMLGNVVSKYNFNFDSLVTFIDLRPTIFDAGIINNIDENAIKCIYGGAGALHLVSLDYDLNLIENKELSSIFSTAGCVTSLSESKYLLTGTARELINTKEQIKVIAFNMNDEKIDSTSYYNNPDSILYAGFVTNTEVIDNHVFTVGNYQFNPSQWPWQNTPTYIQITRMDTNLNIIDHHFYGGDAVYTPYKILATSDGGALITGIRYDHTNPSVQLYHPFALKVNNEGVVVDGIEDELNPISHSAIVFPNPGKDVINLTSGIQLNNGVFTLFDLQGRSVLSKKINATEMQFDASHLVSGTYVWNIMLNNKVMDSGKWVKE
jgi:hypothetical protein